MDIIEYLVSLPPNVKGVFSLLFLIIVGLLVAFFKSSLFQELMTSIFDFIGNKKKKERELETNQSPESQYPPINQSKGTYYIRETDIINHDIFGYIDFWLYTQIPSMNLKTQYRTAVFRKYLHIYFRTYKELISDFVRNGDYKYMESARLRQSLIMLITNIIQTMEIEMRSLGIPDVIIIKMKNVLSDRINLTIELINSIMDSSFYDSVDNYLKVYSFLNIVHSILDNTISNIDPVCNNLNGELAGLSIDGFTEPMGNH